MSTHKVATDAKYQVGSSTDVAIASAPANLYYETEFALLPPAVQPSTGSIQTVDCYNTASVRGTAQNYDLVMDIANVNATDTMDITSITKCWQWIKLKLDDVQVAWLQDVDCAYFCETRNLALFTNSKQDYRNQWIEHGTGGVNNWTSPYNAAFNIRLTGSGAAGGNDAGRVTIPLDYVFSNTLAKWDTALVQKITFEIKWRPDSGNTQINGTFIMNNTANTNIYPDLRVTNSFLQQRLSLYTDNSLFKPLSQMYVKPMLLFERQTFTLSQAPNAGTNPANPARVTIKLSDSFSYHKRIIGLCLILNPNYTTFGGKSKAGDIPVPGQVWNPNGCGAVIRKGGKELENLLNCHKFTRQSNHFQKCLGARHILNSESLSIPGAYFENLPMIFNGNVGNFISFIDRNLMEGHSDLEMLDKIQLVSGISNDLSEAWSVELNLWNTAFGTGPTATYYHEWTNQLSVYMIYQELLGVKAQPGRGAQIKIFS